jgi:hypothetical protein
VRGWLRMDGYFGCFWRGNDDDDAAKARRASNGLSSADWMQDIVRRRLCAGTSYKAGHAACTVNWGAGIGGEIRLS